MSQLIKDLNAAAARLEKELGRKVLDYKYVPCEDLATPLYNALHSTHDQHVIDLYGSTLVCRYLYYLKGLMTKSPGLFSTPEEYISAIIYGGIMYAMKYGAWLDPDKKITADQAIKRCIETVRLQHHYESNLDKHKANYNTLNLDDTNEDGSTSFAEQLVDENHGDPAESVMNDAARSIIQSYIDRDKLMEAVILDVMAFNDSDREVRKTTTVTLDDGTSKKVTEKSREFGQFKCVKLLHNLPENYEQYFVRNYAVQPTRLNVVVQKMRSVPNHQLYRYLRKTISTAQVDLADYRK